MNVDGKGLFDLASDLTEEALQEFCDLFVELVEHYLWCVTEFHRRYGR